MSFTTQDIGQAAWDAFLSSHTEANFLQSWQWGEQHRILGDIVVHRGVYRDEVLVGVYLGIVKNARRGRYLEVPGGPLIEWSNGEVRRAVMQDMRSIARIQRCVFARIRPQLLDSDEHRGWLEAEGLRRAPMHLHAEHTTILDLTPPEETLLERMRRQTRYELRRADKRDLTVEWSTSSQAIEEFFTIQADTARRQHFVPPSYAFLMAQHEAFGDKLRIYSAKKQEQILALALVVMQGSEVVYHEAASTPEGRSEPGAYALQWQIIRDAKQAGFTRYNFWGIAYSDDPHHRYAGVTTFKRGFGGDDVTFVPAYDMVLNPIRYIKNWLIETIRKKKRNL